jgi:hypothetical protein
MARNNGHNAASARASMRMKLTGSRAATGGAQAPAVSAGTPDSGGTPPEPQANATPQAPSPEPTPDQFQTLTEVADEPYPRASYYASGAAGVTTFEGYSPRNGHANARKWLEQEWKDRSAQYREQPATPADND